MVYFNTPSVSRLYGVNGRMTDKLEGIRKEMVVIGRSTIPAFALREDENDGKPRQGRRCSSRDSSQGPPNYEYRALSLRQPSWPLSLKFILILTSHEQNVKKGEAQENSGKTIRVPAEIQTKHLPTMNVRIHPYRYANPLGIWKWIG
jgi:hypothetical protein